MAGCCLRLGNIILLKNIPLPSYPGAVPVNGRRSFGPFARLVLSNFCKKAFRFSVQLFSNFKFDIYNIKIFRKDENLKRFSQGQRGFSLLLHLDCQCGKPRKLSDG